MPSAKASTNFEMTRGSSRRDLSETATILRRYGTSRGVRSTINLKPSLAAMVVYGGSRIAAATLLFTRDSKRAAFPPMLSGTTCSLVKPSSFKHSKSPSIGQAREACDRNGFALAISGRFDRRMNDEG